MKIQALNVLPGDIVRGIGLVVEYSEPHSDFQTALVGHVSTRNPEDGKFEQTPAVIQLPNEHLVNVRRSDENFRNDRVSLVQAALTEFAETGDQDRFASALGHVADMPRGAHTSWGEVWGLTDQFDLAALGADMTLEKLDLLGMYSLAAVVSGEAEALEAGDAPEAEVTTVDFGYPSDVD